MPGNANTVGTPGGSGGGGGSNTGAGGNTHYRSPNPQGIPTVSLDYGHGGVVGKVDLALLLVMEEVVEAVVPVVIPDLLPIKIEMVVA